MVCRTSLEDAAVRALAEGAAAAGYAPARRLLDEWDSGANRFGAPGEIFLAAFDGSLPLGYCGLNRDPFVTDPRVGRVRRLFVDPRHRGRGYGAALVRRILAEAGAFRRIRVRTPAAGNFFERLGFGPIECPDATHEIDPGAHCR